MENLSKTNLSLRLEEIEPLTDEELEWDLINYSSSGVYVKKTIKELDPTCETISQFTEKHYSKIRPLKKINELADAVSTTMWVYEFERGGRYLKIAKTITLCSMLQHEVYDWETDKLMVGFFIVGIPQAEGTTVQTDLDDIEWTIPIFAAQLCAEFANLLADGDCIERGTIN